VQPVLDAEIARHREHAPHLAGVDLAPALAFASAALAAEPRTGPELRTALAARFPELEPAAVAYACRCLLPLVQVPPRGVWGRTGAVRLTPLDAWVGRPPGRGADIEEVLLRYLAAFGPATAADATAWCRLPGMGPPLDRLAPRLRRFTDARGRVLHDLPEAPRPDPDTPAPVRFLPEYDNVLLSHKDRSRFGAGDPRFARVVGVHKGAVLVDGEVRAVWHAERSRDGGPAVVVTHLPLTAADAAAVEAEGARTGAFWHGAPAEVRLVPLA
jgi:hypothetical protein